MDKFDYTNAEEKKWRQEILKVAGSDRLALISLKIEEFIIMMLDEVERSGFSGLEFLVHSQLFLRSITPSYRKEDFLILLRVLNELDSNINKTAFYFSLISLRKICSDSNGLSEVLSFLGVKGKMQEGKDVLSALVMFSTHFIENIIQQLSIMRADKASRQKQVADFKLEIMRSVNQSLSKTLSELVSANMLDQ